MALSQSQINQACNDFCHDTFVATNVTANLNTGDIKAAITAIDNAMNTTLANAVIAVGGTTIIVGGLQQQILNVSPNFTVPQQALLLIYWAKRAAGL